MSGPERIWAWEGDGQDGWANAYATTAHVAIDQVEYLRADGETLSEVRGCLKRMADYMDGKGPDRPFAISRQLRAALAKMGE